MRRLIEPEVDLDLDSRLYLYGTKGRVPYEFSVLGSHTSRSIMHSLHCAGLKRDYDVIDGNDVVNALCYDC